MQSKTLVSLMRTLAEDLYSASRLPLVSGATSGDAADTAHLLDLNGLGDSQADVSLIDGVWVRVDQLVAGGPASGEVSRVDKGGLAGATGILTISPPLTLLIKGSTNYGLHLINPRIMKQGIIGRSNGCGTVSIDRFPLLSTGIWRRLVLLIGITWRVVLPELKKPRQRMCGGESNH